MNIEKLWWEQELGSVCFNTETDTLEEFGGLDARQLGKLDPGKGRAEAKECRSEYENRRKRAREWTQKNNSPD